MPQDQLQGGDEENVLTLLVWDETHSYEVALRVTPDLFSTRAYQHVAKAAINHLTTYGKPPRAHLPDLLENELRRGEHGRALEAALEAMQRLAPDLQPEFVLGRLERFIRLRSLFRTAEAIADAVAEGDIEKAEQAALNRPNTGRETRGLHLGTIKDALSFMDVAEEGDVFSCGVDALDRAGVRPERGTTMLLIAPSGKGKSWFCINAGRANGVQLRHKVLHITLELSARKTMGRYVQNLLALSRKQLEDPRITRLLRDDNGRFTGFDVETLDPLIADMSNRDEIARRLSRFRSLPVYVKEYPSRTLTIPRLIAFLDYLEKAENWKPDLLIVDYPDEMKISAENKRIDLGTTFAEIRGICGTRNMAGIVVTQSGRESFQKHTTRGSMVSEDISKYQTADIVLTYSQTDREERLGLARLLVEKNRDDKDGYTVLVTQHYATGQFAVDSVVMTNDARRELKNIEGVDE